MEILNKEEIYRCIIDVEEIPNFYVITFNHSLYQVRRFCSKIFLCEMRVLKSVIMERRERQESDNYEYDENMMKLLRYGTYYFDNTYFQPTPDAIRRYKINKLLQYGTK